MAFSQNFNLGFCASGKFVRCDFRCNEKKYALTEQQKITLDDSKARTEEIDHKFLTSYIDDIIYLHN